MYQDSGTPVETEESSLTQGCRVTHPSQWEVPLRVSVGDPSPGSMGLGVLSRVAGRPAVRAGQWPSPVTPTPRQCWVPWQGSPVCHAGQQALLVDQSNALPSGVAL